MSNRRWNIHVNFSAPFRRPIKKSLKFRCRIDFESSSSNFSFSTSKLPSWIVRPIDDRMTTQTHCKSLKKDEASRSSVGLKLSFGWNFATQNHAETHKTSPVQIAIDVQLIHFAISWYEMCWSNLITSNIYKSFYKFWCVPIFHIFKRNTRCKIMNGRMLTITSKFGFSGCQRSMDLSFVHGFVVVDGYWWCYCYSSCYFVLLLIVSMLFFIIAQLLLVVMWWYIGIILLLLLTFDNVHLVKEFSPCIN